ncbi:MAG TPA: GAF domain-containing protein [bacterium]|nr:GAF domain-containing protein [bacterium]
MDSGPDVGNPRRAKRRTARATLEAGFRLLFDHNPLPMWVFDRKTLRFLEVNEAAVAHYGYSREEFLALTIADIRPPEDVPRLRAHVSSRPLGLRRVGEWRHRLKSGEPIDVQITSHTLRFGGRDAVLVVAQDITRQKRAEKAHTATQHALRESEARYRSLFEGVPVGLYRTTPAGKLLDVNPRLVSILGYPSHAHLLAVNTPDLYVDPDVRLQWSQRLEREGAVTDFEVQVRRYDGSLIWIRENARSVRDGAGRVVCYEGAISDVTRRRQVAAHLEALNDIVLAAAGAADLRTFLGTLLDRTLAVLEGDRGGVWLTSEPDAHVTRNMAPERSAALVAAASAAGLDFTRVVAVEDWEALTGPPADVLRPALRRAGVAGASLTGPLLLDGRVIGGFAIATARPRRWSPNEIKLAESIGRQVGSVAERLRLLDAVRAHAREMDAVHSLGTALRRAGDLDDVYALITERTMAFLRGDHASLVLVEPDGATFRSACVRGVETVPEGATFPIAGSISGRAIELGGAFLTPDLAVEPESVAGFSPARGIMGPCIAVPMREGERVIGALAIARLRESALGPFASRDVGPLTALAELASNAIHRAQLTQQLAQELENLRGLYESAQRMAGTLDLRRLAHDAVARCVDVFGVSLAWVATIDAGGRPRLVAGHPADTDLPQYIIALWSESTAQGAIGRSLTGGDTVVGEDVAQRDAPPPWVPALLARGLHSVGAFPLITRTRTFGVLGLYSTQPGFFTSERVAFLRGYAHQLAGALENARLYDETARRSAQLQALREIDQVITGSLDLGISLNVVLAKAIALLRVDAACVLLFNPHTQILEYAADHGFQTAVLRHLHIKLGEGLAGRVALERQSFGVPDLDAAPDTLVMTRLPQGRTERFKATYAVPLIAKAQLLGVLQVFYRRPVLFEEDWLEFLDTLAGQTAIAISDARQFEALQRSNADLALAYDTTLAGWARAMEHRDREVEGHTQRVMDLTVRLAGRLGVSADEVVHIRRGVLLHDVGKLGVSDAVLFKRGPLTDEEREMMERYPAYAYELLTPIPYLRPALDIPYCHREKWDGTGYPRGLRGEQIPLAARIFAVADVWDVVRSDRPYRPARSDEAATAHLRGHAGTQFDPTVVEAFLQMVREEFSAAKTT